MKKLVSAVNIILIVSAINVSSQNFFPLNTGNKYQIKNDWVVSGPGGTGDYGTYFKVISVISDTLINGDTFYSMSNSGGGSPFPPNYLYHYDSLNQKLLIKIPEDDSIRLAVDFNTPADSHYISYLRGNPVEFISGGITPEIVLGDTLEVYKMETPWVSNTIFNYKFAEDIGLIYFRYLVIEPPDYGYDSKYFTISAILDSNYFNPLTLEIDSLYPVIDRPIDTFPFILNIPFHVSYSQLINSFRLIIEIERDSIVFYNMNYNISISNPHLQINPPNFQVGDIIKLQAVISDTSIYNNIDLYPDTGWVTFRVLDPVYVNDDNHTLYTYRLEQNYPNPFNPTTKIKYQLPKPGKVKLIVYDMLGREISTLVNEERPTGTYEVEFNGTGLPSGVYFYRIETAKYSDTKKFILIK